jgi:hypothetical protein
MSKDPLLTKHGLSGYNKPKATPSHPTKSHVVLVKVGDRTQLVRFGQAGVKGAGDNPTTTEDKLRKKSFLARHNAQNPNPDKFSALFWSKKVKW